MALSESITEEDSHGCGRGGSARGMSTRLDGGDGFCVENGLILDFTVRTCFLQLQGTRVGHLGGHSEIADM